MEHINTTAKRPRPSPDNWTCLAHETVLQGWLASTATSLTMHVHIRSNSSASEPTCLSTTMADSWVAELWHKEKCHQLPKRV